MGNMQEISSMANIVLWNQVSEHDGLSHIDRLYQRFQGIYMQKWASQFTSDAMLANWRETWGEGLAGLTADQVRRGLNGCANLDWPPSLPEFRRLCVGEQQRNYEAMFREAAELAGKRLSGSEVKWPNSLTYWAARNFGMRELASAAWSSSKSLWIDCVDALLEEEEIKPIPTEEVKELPAPGKRTVTDEEARQRIAQAVSGMRMGGPAKTTDEEFGLNQYNDWIKKAHQTHTKRQTMDAAEAAMKRMGWGEDKIERFKVRYWV